VAAGVPPPLPTVALDRPGGLDEVTVPSKVTHAGATPPTPPLDDTASSAATVVTASPSGLQRRVAIGTAALVVLALLLYFMQGGTPDSEMVQAENQAVPEVTDVDTAAPAATEDSTPASDPAGTESTAREPVATEPTLTTPASPPSAGQTEPATPTTVSSPASAPAEAGAGEPPSLLDTPSDRNNALLEAAARIEADRIRRDAEAAARDPFPEQGDGTFLDRQIGTRWTAASSPVQGTEGLLWTDANSYCDRLSLAGISNWRLPTRDELDSVLQRLDPTRYPWGLTLWSADRPLGDSNRLWVTNSPLYAPEWSTAVRDASARRLTHRAVCVASGTN
jgi:hypothetical protein